VGSAARRICAAACTITRAHVHLGSPSTHDTRQTSDDFFYEISNYEIRRVRITNTAQGQPEAHRRMNAQKKERKVLRCERTHRKHGMSGECGMPIVQSGHTCTSPQVRDPRARVLEFSSVPFSSSPQVGIYTRDHVYTHTVASPSGVPVRSPPPRSNTLSLNNTPHTHTLH
jgi:hypothetical protein